MDQVRVGPFREEKGERGLVNRLCRMEFTDPDQDQTRAQQKINHHSQERNPLLVTEMDQEVVGFVL